MIIHRLALRARWLFYHFISNSGSWNNCYLSYFFLDLVVVRVVAVVSVVRVVLVAVVLVVAVVRVVRVVPV